MTDADKGKRPADEWTVGDRGPGNVVPVACAGVNVAYFVLMDDAVRYRQAMAVIPRSLRGGSTPAEAYAMDRAWAEGYNAYVSGSTPQERDAEFTTMFRDQRENWSRGWLAAFWD